MPKVFQPTSQTFDTADFSVVATLLDFYGLPYSVRSLNDYLHHHPYGSLMTEIADCLLQHGLNITLINANPLLFSKQVWDQIFLLDYPRTTPEKLPTINEVQRVVSKGVYLKRLMPSIAMIDNELAHERPVIISYNPALIDSMRPQGVSHAILTKGDDATYSLFEPDYEESLTTQPKQYVLYAIAGVKTNDPAADSIILSSEKSPAPTTPPGPPPDLDSVTLESEEKEDAKI